MSKLNIDQKSIKNLFTEKNTDFLIPDYQRPYAWGEKECQTLQDDLFLFAFPDNDCDKFDSMKNDKALKTSKLIEQCIWKTDKLDEPNKSALKIDSEVATDSNKEQFLNILKIGIVDDNWKSSYANNYRFFKKKCLMNG